MQKVKPKSASGFTEEEYTLAKHVGQCTAMAAGRQADWQGYKTNGGEVDPI